MSRSCALWVFLFLGICTGIATATARDLQRETLDLSGRRWQPVPERIRANPFSSPPSPVLSTLSRHHHRHHSRYPPRWRHHRHHRNHQTPPPLAHSTHSPPPPPPVDRVSPPPPTLPSHVVPPPSPPPPVDKAAPPLTPDCAMVLINVDGCISDLITSFFKDRVSLSTNCCNVVSRISDDCFDRAFTHFRVPIFLRRVRNYCSHQR